MARSWRLGSAALLSLAACGWNDVEEHQSFEQYPTEVQYLFFTAGNQTISRGSVTGALSALNVRDQSGTTATSSKLLEYAPNSLVTYLFPLTGGVKVSDLAAADDPDLHANHRDVFSRRKRRDSAISSMPFMPSSMLTHPR